MNITHKSKRYDLELLDYAGGLSCLSGTMPNDDYEQVEAMASLRSVERELIIKSDQDLLRHYRN